MQASSSSVKSMQIQAGQNMPLAGFYGSELMNAANEAGSSNSNENNNKNNTGKGHYFGRVPAPTPPDPAPSATPALQCNGARLPVSLWLRKVLALPRLRAHVPTAHFLLCNNRNNLSPGPD